jgi:hypothetical protein
LRETEVFSSDNHVGRLVELRVATPFAEDELARLLERHVEVIQGVGGDFVVAVDFRRAHVFPAAIAEGFVRLMGRVNPALIRSGVLINESAVFGLQAERAIVEAGHPERKVFRAPADLERWLGEVLTVSERRRLVEFLAGPRQAGPRQAGPRQAE